MLFERLLLENLGVFKGQHSLDLMPTDPQRPIVLVGALNGSGKTTVIEALQLALYGKRAGYGWRGAGGYPSYLEQVRNRHAEPSEPTVAEVTLRLADGRRLRIHRHWSFAKAQPREYLSVYLNGEESPDLALSENWDEEVERLLPARLSELFFFDGERIEKLADPTQSADVLRAAVASLLGLDLVDHLTVDLDILRMRQKQKVLSEGDQGLLKALNAQYDAACQVREDTAQKTAAVTAKLDRARAVQEAVDRKVRERGGELFHQRERLTADVVAAGARLEALEQQGRALSAGSLPLSLVVPVLRGLLTDAKRKSEAADSRTVASLRQQVERIQGWVRRQEFSVKAKQDLKEYLDTIRSELVNVAATNSGVRWERVAVRLDGLLTLGLEEAKGDAARLLHELTLSSEKLHGLQERLAQVPEQEQVAELLKAQGAAEATVSGLAGEATQCEVQAQSVERSIQGIRQQRNALLERDSESTGASRIADYCQRSLKSLAQFRADLVQRRREQLEQLILEAFQLLARKSDLVGQIKLDNETMGVSLLGTDGQPVATQQLSAGERQLLAVAMLWGLARASGRPVPVVIDTPLGRLDGEHRKALVERYFPDASHQVILLSTDQEVDADFSQMLDDSVAHRYLIGYNELMRSSSFRQGYFGEQ